MAMHDLMIRGATVVDGLGHDPIRADVAVKDGRIGEIGEFGKNASEIVDAGGLTLMPGIIDLHTHYDAQVTWDPTLCHRPHSGSRPPSWVIAASVSCLRRRTCAI
jgi:N-acyl-D-aspartate/D-glutamate deacylase